MNDIMDLIIEINDEINDKLNNEIKDETYYCYVMVSRLLSKNLKKEDGLPSIDHEILIDLEETIEMKDYKRITYYIIMLEYSKRDYPILIKNINLIIKKYKKI